MKLHRTLNSSWTFKCAIASNLQTHHHTSIYTKAYVFLFFFGSSPLLQILKQHGDLITASLSEKEHLVQMQTCCKTEMEKDTSDPERDTKTTLIKTNWGCRQTFVQLGTSSAASTATPEPVTACKTKTAFISNGPLWTNHQ